MKVRKFLGSAVLTASIFLLVVLLYSKFTSNIPDWDRNLTLLFYLSLIWISTVIAVGASMALGKKLLLLDLFSLVIFIVLTISMFSQVSPYQDLFISLDLPVLLDVIIRWVIYIAVLFPAVIIMYRVIFQEEKEPTNQNSVNS